MGKLVLSPHRRAHRAFANDAEREQEILRERERDGLRLIGEVKRDRTLELLRLKLCAIAASSDILAMKDKALECIDIIVEAK